MTMTRNLLKHRWLPYALLLVPLIVGLALFFQWRARQIGDTISPIRGPIVEAVYGLGTVTATKTFDLKFGVITNIEELYVTEGQKVEKGDKLLRILEGGVQRAPFAGTITALPFKVQETIFPQTTVLSLVDLSDLYVLVSLEQHSVLRVKPGQEARLSFENIRGDKVLGKVESVYPSNGQFYVRVNADHFPAGVLPGMTVDVAIEVSRRSDALLVPVAAVRSGKVIVLDGVRRKKVDIKIGSIDGEWAEVVSGPLTTDDKLVLRRK